MFKLTSSWRKSERISYIEGLKFVKNRDLAIDCGAYFGLWSEWMSKDFKKVISIEPANINFQKLVDNKILYLWKNVELVNAAAMDKDGYCEIWNNKANKVSGNWSTKKIGQYSQEIKSIKLDNLNVFPDYIKMDIQGSELLALQGSTIILIASNPVLNIETIFDNNRTTVIHNFLKDYNYISVKKINKNEIFIKNV